MLRLALIVTSSPTLVRGWAWASALRVAQWHGVYHEVDTWGCHDRSCEARQASERVRLGSEVAHALPSSAHGLQFRQGTIYSAEPGQVHRARVVNFSDEPKLWEIKFLHSNRRLWTTLDADTYKTWWWSD